MLIQAPPTGFSTAEISVPNSSAELLSQLYTELRRCGLPASPTSVALFSLEMKRRTASSSSHCRRPAAPSSGI